MSRYYRATAFFIGGRPVVGLARSPKHAVRLAERNGAGDWLVIERGVKVILDTKFRYGPDPRSKAKIYNGQNLVGQRVKARGLKHK